jgi:hypothetical protein
VHRRDLNESVRLDHDIVGLAVYGGTCAEDCGVDLMKSLREFEHGSGIECGWLGSEVTEEFLINLVAYLAW